MSGAYPHLSHPPGDPGSSNKRDGRHTGPTLPGWADPLGDHGQVIILRIQGAERNLPNRPTLIRKSVEAYLGVKITDAYPERKGISYMVKVRNQRHAEKLKGMKQLSDGFPIQIIEHPVLNQSKCVISCRESVNYETEEILDELKEQGVTAVRRITRREGNESVPTPTLILTIDGTVTPQNIDFGWIRCKTRPYYPAPMLCYGCFDYGHTRARCQQKTPTCSNCCGEHTHTPEAPCQEAVFCKHCKKSDHPVSSRKCPTYAKEVEIGKLRVDMGIGYPAARRIYESEHRTQTAASIVAAGNDQRFAELNAKFDRLLIETGKKDAKLSALIAENQEKDDQINALISSIKERDTMIAERDIRIAALEAAFTSVNERLPTATAVASFKGSSNDQIALPQRTKKGKKGTKENCSSADATTSAMDRLELTRKHGTIEDLVAENQLLKKKDVIQSQVIESLRKGSEKRTATTMHNADDSHSSTPTNGNPSHKKSLGNRNSSETITKRTKTDQTTMEISDDESPKTNSQTSELYIPSDLFSSDEMNDEV